MYNGETWLVTGANRGIGLEVVRGHLQRGGRVYASSRNLASPGLAALRADYPDRLSLLLFDVRDNAAIAAAATQVHAPIDVIFNNAGIFGARDSTFRKLDTADALDAFDVNALGMVRVVDAFLPFMAGAARPRIAAVSSQMGAVSRPGAGQLAYRASKAAMNRIVLAMAEELRPSGIPVAALRPGWVRTDMGGDKAPLSAAESAKGLIAVVDAMILENTPAFFDLTGEVLEW